MQFSCKISHSILTYLDRQGVDLGVFFETCEYPAEFLRNPSHWLDADKMEDLLTVISRDYNSMSREGNLILEAGHQCKELRAWGVLDSVLRMVQSPRDIYSQPDRFIGYFVSPAPPVGNILREPGAVFFELPIAASQYPLVTAYLRAALEALPTYVDKAMATVQWSEIRVSVSWSEAQESLFGEEQAPPTHLNPEVLQSILHNLETTQKQLEETKLQLQERERELKLLKCNALEATPLLAAAEARAAQNYPERWRGLAQGLKAEVSVPAQDVLNQIYRLNDYMGRAHQLVTLLVGQGRDTPQVREAMRRVDWAFVTNEMPTAVKQAASGIRKIQDTIKDFSWLAVDINEQNTDEAQEPERKVPTDLNQVVAKALAAVRPDYAKSVQVDEHLLLDREVPVHPKPIEKALTGLLKNALQSIDGQGSVRVVTRPNGRRAEIEITDTGIGMNENTLARAAEPFFTTQRPGTAAGLGLTLAQQIVRGHDGSINVTSRPGQGTTVVVSLPLNSLGT